ncbi:hypothetical protein, partial [Bradyrhizobium pachyrhizi]|uniref:hypothetical protein n=1 Tax=Bradyrhizobium pachyrhizi TaxID=280333 RepID=UPI001AEDBFDE
RRRSRTDQTKRMSPGMESKQSTANVAGRGVELNNHSTGIVAIDIRLIQSACASGGRFTA